MRRKFIEVCNACNMFTVFLIFFKTTFKSVQSGNPKIIHLTPVRFAESIQNKSQSQSESNIISGIKIQNYKSWFFGRGTMSKSHKLNLVNKTTQYFNHLQAFHRIYL